MAGKSARFPLCRRRAFCTAINHRDTFLGEPHCVVCGVGPRPLVEHGIIAESQLSFCWDLKRRNWVPPQAKNYPGHEPRNGLLMCLNHHNQYDKYSFLIRLFPDIRKFVFVNFSDDRDLRQFHGKAIALDIRDRSAPLPSLFVVHEMRVRGFNSFQPVDPDMPDDVQWQDWILSEGVFNEESGCFNRDGPPRNVIDSVSVQSQLEFQPTTTGEGGATSSGRTLPPLNENVIADILAATRSSESWKACVMEGTSWTGTAEENIDKYGSSVGLEDPPP